MTTVVELVLSDFIPPALLWLFMVVKTAIVVLS